MLSDTWTFVSAVFRWWQSLLTGGVIALVILIGQAVMKKSISWRVLGLLMGLALFVSCFLAWRDEFNRANTLHDSQLVLEERDSHLVDPKTRDEQIAQLQKRVHDLESTPPKVITKTPAGQAALPSEPPACGWGYQTHAPQQGAQGARWITSVTLHCNFILKTTVIKFEFDREILNPRLDIPLPSGAMPLSTSGSSLPPRPTRVFQTEMFGPIPKEQPLVLSVEGGANYYPKPIAVSVE